MLQPDRIVSTTCPYCGVGCTLELHLKGDTIYKVTSPFDSPVNHGNLCVKGRFGYDFIYSPKRVTTPLIRKTPQQPGQRTQAFDRSEWREASWDEALNLIADRLVEIYRRDGSDALAVYCCAKATNEDNYLLQKMYPRAVPHQQHRSLHAAVPRRLGGGAAQVAGHLGHEQHRRRSHPQRCLHRHRLQHHRESSHHRAAHERSDSEARREVDRDRSAPHRVVRSTPRCSCRLQPGTNVVVFNAMAHVIVKEGLINRAFIDARTEGYDGVRQIDRDVHARICRIDQRRRSQSDHRSGAAVCHREERRDLLGHGHLATFARARPARWA